MDILIILIAVIIAFIVVVSVQPSEFKVMRTATVAAPAEIIFPHINNLHKWEAWSPWAKLDPSAKNTFNGPDSGTGASLSWVGNNKVGIGSMEITESRNNEYIKFRLDFLKPMKATNIAEFTFKQEGLNTIVTWGMSGRNNFIGKAVGLLLNCEKMVGGQFEKGLADIKIIAEAEAKK